MPVNLIHNSVHFTRAELPEILYQVQRQVYDWTEKLTEPGRTKIRSLIPPIDPRVTKPEILGAIDETMPVYCETKDLLVRYQAFFDNSSAANEAGEVAKSIADDVIMMLLLRVVLNCHWMLQAYAKAVAKGLTFDATQLMISDMYAQRHLQEEWKQ